MLRRLLGWANSVRIQNHQSMTSRSRRRDTSIRPLRVESLEDRWMLTSVAYLDFGDNFPVGGLDMTVLQLRNTFANGGIQGPDLREFSNGSVVDYQDTLGLQFTGMAPLVTFDYNGSGGVNGTDYTDLRAAVLGLTQRYYNNLDINVVLAPALNNTSDATYLQGIRDTLNLGAAVNGERDAWVFVSRITRTDTNLSVGFDKSLNGIAAGADISGNNARDDSAIAFADVVIGNQTTTTDTRLAYTAAHEAGHTFGQRHRNNGTSGTALDADMAQLTRSELVTESAGTPNRTNFVFNTRYPLIRGDGNNNPPPGTNSFNANDVENQFTQLAGNGRLGVRAGAPDFVTGTGANDRITITRLNATQATVSVQAFRDTAYTSAITVPGQAGTTFTYTINTTNGILVEGGFGTDQITIDATIGGTITVRGMAGTSDQLIVAGGGLASGTYTPAGAMQVGLDGNNDFRGQITIVGGATINLEEFQTTGSVNVQNLGSFTLRTPNSADNLTIDTLATATNRVAGSSGGVNFVPLVFSNIASFVLDTGTNDGSGTGNDTINLNSVFIATGLQNFTVNTGSGNDIDRFNVNTNSIALPAAGGAFTINGGLGGNDTLVFSTASPSAVTYTPDASNSPDRGSLAFAGASMLFTGLEFVRPVTPVINGISLAANAINEGANATLSGTFIDPGSLSKHSLLVDWGDGSVNTLVNLPVGARSFQILHPYLDDNPTSTPFDVYNIKVTIMDDDGLANMTGTSITVNNVAPVITSFNAGAPSDGNAKEGVPITATGSFTDVGILDTHTAVIDWGDGTSSAATVAEAGGIGTFLATHTYATGGIFNVKLLLTDDDTGFMTIVDTVFITGAGINIVNGKKVLQVVGTNQIDNVIVDEPGSGKINVYAAFLTDLANRRSFNRAGIDYVEVVLRGGDDKATVSGWITVPAVVDGGEGNDRLIGGRGGIVLIGGKGKDYLAGSTQRSILIGGSGEDELIGRADDDILIGGRTLYDSGIDENQLANDAALIRLLQEWRVPDSASQRKARIEAGVDGVFLRLGQSVFDDGGAEDRLTGSTGVDWFWLLAGDKALDYHANLDLATVPGPAPAPGLETVRVRPPARSA